VLRNICSANGVTADTPGGFSDGESPKSQIRNAQQSAAIAHAAAVGGSGGQGRYRRHAAHFGGERQENAPACRQAQPQNRAPLKAPRAFFRKKAYNSANQKKADVDHILNAGDLTLEEMASLRLVVRHSFMSKSAISTSQRARLVELGLITNSMGGILPTPAGRIAARG
jgi:hypothetical protein